MRIESELSPKIYLQKVKRHMGAFTSFGDERFTGFVVGNFFSIVYHSGLEWNRRITNEKNRAIGYVRKNPHGQGSEVHFIRLRGLTNPISLIGMFLLCYGFSWLFFMLKGSGVEPEVWHWASLWTSMFFTAGMALSTAISAGWTERGIYGRTVLMALLRHPNAPYQNIDPNDR